ncbi:MAG: PAS domain-containing protein [Sandaracinus sp.]|nr:PAS domain-containing protein [Sandaracinus sp.]
MSDRSRPTLERRQQWLIALRVIVVTLLFGGVLGTAIVGERPLDGFTPRALIGIIAAAYAASAGFSVWLLRSGPTVWSARTQVAFDLVLTTMLVYLSGGAGSVFTVLFGVTVLEAAIALGSGAARVTAALALVAHFGLGYALVSGVVPPPPDQDPRGYALDVGELGFSFLSNGVALLLLSALSSSLTERLARAGGRLEELEASAARLAQMNADIVGSMHAGLVTLDAEGMVMSANPAALHILGLDSDRDLLGTSLTPWLSDLTHGRGETVGRRADGETVIVGFTQTPLVRGDGGSLVLFQDLTEIRELRAQAERVERHTVLGRLASGLAHEIRNPLGSISGSVQLVREAPTLDEEDRHLLGVVLDEVERLNELVTTMLDVGRTPNAEREPTDLVRMATDLLAVARADSTLARTRVELEVPESLHAEVDANRVRQLLWNLLKNAVQASPPDGRVWLRVAGDERSVVLEVEDEGPGIPEADRGRLFDMFWSKRTHGIGLGLALVKQIVEMHEGTIEVGEGRHGGAHFRVTLPRSGSAVDSTNA